MKLARLLLALLLPFPLALGCKSSGSAPPLPQAAPAGPFGWLIGDWEGMRLEEADGSSAPMILRVQSVLGGAGQLEELKVEHSRGTYRGLHLRLRDRETGRWTSEYANAVTCRFTELEGELGADDESSWRSVPGAGSRASWLEYERLAPDRWRRTQRVSDDGGRTWRVLFTDELERRR